MNSSKHTFLKPVFFFLSFFFSVIINAQDGQLDLSFAIGTGFDNTVKSVIYQPDGKILAAGNFNNYNGTAVGKIVRLNYDGTLDNTFSISGTGINLEVWTMVLQNDGKIIAGGDFSTSPNVGNRIIRLNSDGTTDLTFSTGSGFNGTVFSIAIQPDAKILVGGYFTSLNGSSKKYIARLNYDGTTDALFTMGTGFDSYVYKVLALGSGKILACGTFTNYNGTARNYIAQINNDGTIDPSFLPTGTGFNASLHTMAIQPDGKILAGGYFTGYDGNVSNYIARLEPNGTRDLTFQTGTGFNATVHSFYIQSDGKIIAGGEFTAYDGTTRNGIVRLNTNGTIDTNFDPGAGLGGGTVTIYDMVGVSLFSLMIGGNFNSYDNIPRNKLAQVNVFCSNSVWATASNPTLCAGNTTTITAGGTMTFTWMPGNITGTSSIVVTPTVSTTYTVKGYNGLCNSSGTIAINVIQIPAQPGSISGNTLVAAGSSETYSVAPVPGAATYIWSVPSGWSGSSTNNSINVTTNSAGGTVSVIAQNMCGTSAAASLSVAINSCTVPTQPAAISGNTTPAAGAGEIYSVPPVSGATSYAWTLPAGYSGSSTNNSINVTIGNTGGIISVVAQNTCGISAARALNITVGGQGGGGTTNCSAQLVKDIAAGSSGSSIALIKNVNNRLYFAADDWVVSNELWTSDGTGPNTQLVKDINTNGDALSVTFPTRFAAINNIVFFIAITDNEGAELWKSDGTAAGTMMVKDINPGTSSGIIVTHAELIHFNGYVYFQADDGVNGEELWRTDGSAAGTIMVKNIAAGWIDAYIKNFTVSGSNLFFSANDSSIGEELWKTDGTSAGTVLVKNIASSGGSFPQFLTDVNGTLFFGAYTTAEGKELWKSDGTTAGTVLVKDINPGPNPSIQYTNVNNFVGNGNVLYFTATDGVNGIELWKSDGTNSGTVLIKDVRPGSNGGLDVSNYKNFKVINNILYFMGNDGVNGSELWKSDGTGSGTVLVKDIRPGSVSSDPKEFIVYNTNLLFVASSNGVERLWLSDGTTTGTAIVDSQGPTTPRNLTEMGGNVYFSAYTSAFGNELYVCTPSVIGIKEESTLPDLLIYPNPGTGVFSIRSENHFSYSSIKIYNTHGQVVYTSNKQVEEIDLTSQPKGIYFIEIISDKGVINKKVILQ